MNEFLQTMTPAVANAAGIILIALAGYLITFINKKKAEIQQSTDSAIADKYLDMVASTISNCVAMTTQTYVDALKNKDSFTAKAQKEAFNKTMNNVMELLTADALVYLGTITDDVNAYLTTAIEAEVAKQKA